jgi:ABC-type glycerol-3-phosphate transport system substrate-binding protein
MGSRAIRLLSVVCALGAMSVLAACGGGSDKGSTSTAGASAKAISGTITIWDWQYSSPTFGKALKEIDTTFEAAHPGLKIKHVAQPIDNYDQIVRAAATSRSGPDVLMLYPGGTGVFNYLPTLENLAGNITPEMKKDVVGFDLAAPDYQTSKGIYGVPLQTQGLVFYYNKKLFKKAGLDPETPPTTYDELVADAKKLKAAGIVPLGGGNKEGYEAAWWFSALWPGVASQQDSVDLAAGKIKFTDPRVKDVLGRLVDLKKQGLFADTFDSTPLFPDAVDSFAAGKQAMFLGLASDAASYVQFDPALGSGNVGVFQVPGVKSDKPNFLPIGPGLMLTIPKYAKNKAAAAAYIQYAAGREAGTTLFKLGGVLPANKAVTLSDAPPQVTQMLQAFTGQPTFSPPHGLWKAAVNTDIGKQMQSVLAGKESLDAALKSVDATQQKP